MAVNGESILPYVPRLEKILSKTLHMANKDGYGSACATLKHILRSFTFTYNMELKSDPLGWDRDIKEHLPIRVSLLTSSDSQVY